MSGCGATRAAPWRGVSFNKNAFFSTLPSCFMLCLLWSSWKWANISPLSVTAVVPRNFAQSYSTNVVFFFFAEIKPDPIQQRRVLLRLKQNPERKSDTNKNLSRCCVFWSVWKMSRYNSSAKRLARRRHVYVMMVMMMLEGISRSRQAWKKITGRSLCPPNENFIVSVVCHSRRAVEAGKI